MSPPPKHSSMLESSVDEGGRPSPVTNHKSSSGAAPVSRMSSGRFDIGSDTGTSTRESDCASDEHHHRQQSPVMDGMKVTLFDDLAAELREKLNGNGPPLLLPPRDYDTVHRSKGNLAASELRRCQNQLVVGAGVKGSKQTIVSSRGSSGIGSSDMAPSPERHDGQTSSGKLRRFESPFQLRLAHVFTLTRVVVYWTVSGRIYAHEWGFLPSNGPSSGRRREGEGM